MNLEELLAKSKKLAIAPATALCMLFSFHPSFSSHADLDYSFALTQVKTVDWEYDLDIAVLGFIEFNNRDVECTRTVKEDSDYIEESFRAVKHGKGDSFWGYYEGKRKVSKSDSENDFYEEYTIKYHAQGLDTVRKAKIYPGYAEVIDDDGDWIKKKGDFIGLLSLFSKMSEGDFVNGEKFSGKLLYGGYTYRLEAKVNHDLINLYGSGNISTYRFKIELKNKDINEVKKKAKIWVGRDGVYDGKLLKADAKPKWAVKMNFVLKEADVLKPFDVYFEAKKEE